MVYNLLKTEKKEGRERKKLLILISSGMLTRLSRVIYLFFHLFVKNDVKFVFYFSKFQDNS